MNKYHVSPENCILLKFAQSQHAQEICDGKLYCNNVDFFRRSPTNGGQGDDKECTAYHYIDENNRVKIQLDGHSNFLFCMYSLPPSQVIEDRGYYKLSDEAREKFMQFGGGPCDVDCIYIPEPDKYIAKVVEACEQQGILVEPSMVSYLDTHEYKPDPDNRILNWLAEIVRTKSNATCVAFIKQEDFSWQQEFRFLFYNVPQEKILPSGAFRLDIGNVDGIVYREKNCFSSFLQKQ